MTPPDHPQGQVRELAEKIMDDAFWSYKPDGTRDKIVGFNRERLETILRGYVLVSADGANASPPLIERAREHTDVAPAPEARRESNEMALRVERLESELSRVQAARLELALQSQNAKDSLRDLHSKTNALVKAAREVARLSRFREGYEHTVAMDGLRRALAPFSADPNAPEAPSKKRE